MVYTGKIRVAAYKDEPAKIIKGLHEPIITPEIFEKVQDILAGKRRKHKRRDKSHLYPLKMILKCNNCKRSLTASASQNRVHKLYHYYHCVKTRGHDRFPVEQVHSMLDSLLGSINTPREIVSLYQAIVLNEYNTQNKGLNKELEEIKLKIDGVQKKMRKIEDELAEGELGIPDYKRMMIRFEGEENDLILKHATLKTETLPMKKELDYAITLFENFGSLYKSGSPELKSVLLGSIFPYPLYYSKDNFRTHQVNSLFELFVMKPNELQSLKIETSRLSGDSSSMAPAAGLEPATL
jgi:site-specific DNA recombinase